MDLAYAAADLVLSRGGANSVIEAAAVGLPGIFVPLPIGNGEQEHNARPVVDAGGALLVKDADLTSAWVASHVPALVTDPARLAAMGSAAAGLVPRDADERLARMIAEVVLEAAGEDA
jgi:UDP-N-acetylglucosamine--N-acetylmuramyl-(pentapeptide) pyrophosphoryl-undecaprenol N-acetylglucosamine transferase